MALWVAERMFQALSGLWLPQEAWGRGCRKHLETTHILRGEASWRKEPTLLKPTDLSSFRELRDKLGGASPLMGKTEGKRHVQISSAWS